MPFDINNKSKDWACILATTASNRLSPIDLGLNLFGFLYFLFSVFVHTRLWCFKVFLIFTWTQIWSLVQIFISSHHILIVRHWDILFACLKLGFECWIISSQVVNSFWLPSFISEVESILARHTTESHILWTVISFYVQVIIKTICSCVLIRFIKKHWSYSFLLRSRSLILFIIKLR